MIIKNLTLINHRNYELENVVFHDNTNILVGDNAQGKTNLLESIYILARGSTFKNIKENNIIRFDCENSYIRADILNGNRKKTVEVKFSQSEKKRIRINEVEIEKLNELRSQFGVVLFSPEDLKIVKEGPVLRRKFIDDIIANNDINYKKYLNKYRQILNQRNNLLKKRGRDKYFEQMLKALDQQMVDYGSKVIIYRYKYIEMLKILAIDYHAKLTDEKEVLSINYDTNVGEDLSSLSQIEKDYSENLKRSLARDLEYRNTFIGSHKDDLDLFINGMDVKLYASQGQQRTTMLSLKLAEMALIEKLSKSKPILLLDDVFSELDNYRASSLVKNIEGYQNIITTNNLDNLDQNKLNGQVLKIVNGKIKDYR